MDLKERFLKYVSYATQSSEESGTFPSTEKQKVLLAALRDEMEALGMTEVSMDQYGYVMGTVPATPGCENAPVIGFIAHVDTSPDMSGKDVKPHVIEEYDGCDIALNGQLTMRVTDFPELEFFKGHTLIHTDGTTLLGADDKAGVAEIMTAAEYLLAHPRSNTARYVSASRPTRRWAAGSISSTSGPSAPTSPTRSTAAWRANWSTRTSTPPAPRSPCRAATSTRVMPRTR